MDCSASGNPPNHARGLEFDYSAVLWGKLRWEPLIIPSLAPLPLSVGSVRLLDETGRTRFVDERDRSPKNSP